MFSLLPCQSIAYDLHGFCRFAAALGALYSHAKVNESVTITVRNTLPLLAIQQSVQPLYPWYTRVKNYFEVARTGNLPQISSPNGIRFFRISTAVRVRNMDLYRIPGIHVLLRNSHASDKSCLENTRWNRSVGWDRPV